MTESHSRIRTCSENGASFTSASPTARTGQMPRRAGQDERRRDRAWCAPSLLHPFASLNALCSKQDVWSHRSANIHFHRSRTRHAPPMARYVHDFYPRPIGLAGVTRRPRRLAKPIASTSQRHQVPSQVTTTSSTTPYFFIPWILRGSSSMPLERQVRRRTPSRE